MPGTVYVAPCQITTPARLAKDRRKAKRRYDWAPTDITEGFVAAVHAGEWPYGPSDDPSFYSTRHLPGGSLSWGICRRNVRNLLSKGDVVVFIGFEDRDGLVTYQFCAYATVADKVVPWAIWTNDELAVYRRYLNLLARPVGGSFQHYEPHLDATHEDWLWRMTEGGNGVRLQHFAKYTDRAGGMAVRMGSDRDGNGKPIRLAKNYVIFERDYPHTFIVDDPPLLAERQPGDRYETWRSDGFAEAIREITLGRSHRQILCDCRAPYPHPHVRLADAVDGQSWRNEAAALLTGCGRRSLT